MARGYTVAVLSLLLWAAPAAAMDFAALLAETELRLELPAGYQDVGARVNPVLSYEHAVRSADGLLEIRYVLRPIKRLQIEYIDPHGAVPDPNHIFPLMFESLVNQLAGGRHAPSRTYSNQDAAELFRADWAAAAVFDVTPDFASDYSQGLMLALHRSKVSDAYVVFLFDDYPQVKPAINAAMASLAYLPRPDATVTSASAAETPQ